MRRPLVRWIASTTVGLLLLATAAKAATPTTDASHPFERTEERAACREADPQRRPFFGDLHVHTSYSFDSYISSQRNDPPAAYRYARGETIVLPDADGRQTVEARLHRPLDFAAVTDHSEFLGQIAVCTMDPWKLGYWWPHCIMTRASHLWTQLIAASWWTRLGGMAEEEPQRSFACTLSDCDAAGSETWQAIQQAADTAYDRSAECRFTSFVGYEYTESPGTYNLHRNVIFRNDAVTPMPISAYETGEGSYPELWRRLREECLDAPGRCDVLAIPHNSNLAGGLMFQDPKSPEEARDRARLETVVELTQHKGASECRFDRLAGRGVETSDELCTFEQIKGDNLSMLGSVDGELLAEKAAYVPIERFAPRDMVRNALKAGLVLEQQSGVNPFELGFIGSTDTHSASPGGAEEDNYTGHLGRRDAGHRNVEDHFFSNPGGLAVVWAEENSRDAIFSALRRRETYATSGTRPLVRFFAGADLDPALCDAPDMIARAYAAGVPMGGRMTAREGGRARFLVQALKDPGIEGHPGTDLQRVQIVKGWVDSVGATHEQVFDVAGRAENGASVDPETCEPKGEGSASLCTVWEDPAFEAGESSFYYVRVLENPTCRWSTRQCQAAGVNPLSSECKAQAARENERARAEGAKGDVYGKCCLAEADDPFYSALIQERAWTSPIWYAAGSRQN